MEEKVETFEKAKGAILEIVNTFSHLRKDNSQLNDLLQNIESPLQLSKEKTERSTTYPEIEDETSAGDLSTTSSSSASCSKGYDDKFQNANGVKGRGKKRKLSDLDENSDSDVDGRVAVNDAGEKSKQDILYELRENASEDEEKSPQDKVFAIDLLMELILGHLTLPDLKSCRSVNFQWTSIATKLLLRRDAFKIEFKLFNRSKNSFLCIPSKILSTVSEGTNINTNNTDNSTEGKHSLNTLTALVESSFENGFTFPCGSFTFSNGTLSSADLQSFLAKFGFIVKHLKLDIINSNNDSELGTGSVSGSGSGTDSSDQFNLLNLFRKLITSILPNVESLDLGKFPTLWNNKDDLSQLFPDLRPQTCKNNNNILSKLKSIYFSSCEDLPKKMLKDLTTASVSKNFQSIGLAKCKSGSVILTLIDCKRIHLLTSLEVCLSRPNFEMFNTLAEEHKPLKLTKLVTTVDWTHSGDNFHFIVTETVGRLLKSCSESLQVLYMQPLGNFRLEFPVLPKLKIIRMLNDEDIQVKLLPTNLKISSVFPSLQSLEAAVFYSLDDYDMFMEWNTTFGAASSDRLSTVKTINFACGPPLSWIQNFSAMFQNLTSLRVGFVLNFLEASKVFWKMPLLEKLEFNIILHNSSGNEYPTIDAGFTGFSKETCLQLYRTSRDANISELDALRTNPSILDAKRLQKLHMMIYLEGENDAQNKITIPYISHVSGLFAFRLCPQVQVTVSAGGSNDPNKQIATNGLSSILPYVAGVTKARAPFNPECMEWAMQ